MLTHRKIHQLANQFVKAYPTTLAERLEWWYQVLKLNRVLFLQLLGMSPQQAVENKERDWDEILQDTEWENRGIALADRLAALLTIYHYDWKGLSELLQRPLDRGGHAEPAFETRDKGKVSPLPNGSSAEPQSPFSDGELRAFSALQGYLSQPR